MGDLIILADRRHPAAPARTVRIISGICDALDGNRRCCGLLAYENGRWVHALACHSCRDKRLLCDDPDQHRSCPAPEPRQCAHPTCREPADIDVSCVNGDRGQCDGCCWELDDQLEGARRWIRMP